MAKRYFVQLAHDYEDHGTAYQYVSEKLDGQRAFWDGGVSRGKLARDVPYANTVKDDRYIDQNVYATGLWTRGGKVIHAPDWFLNQLPNFMVDGELWLGRGKFQEMRSFASTLIPDDRWKAVKYMIFDKPSPSVVFADGDVAMSADITVPFRGVLEWYNKQRGLNNPEYQLMSFHDSYNFLRGRIKETDNVLVHSQIKLPASEEEARKEIQDLLETVTAMEGEGLMIRDPWAAWRPNRVYSILKIKKVKIEEARVIGYTTGRETEKGSQHRGRMGALIVDYKGQRLKLSGFNHSERYLYSTNSDDAYQWAWDHPEEECPEWITNHNFPRNTVVALQYRELTDDGIPKEARYFRR